MGSRGWISLLDASWHDMVVESSLGIGMAAARRQCLKLSRFWEVMGLGWCQTGVLPRDLRWWQFNERA